MLSKEMQQWFEVVKASKTDVTFIPPEFALAARNAVNEGYGKFPVPEDIEVAEDTVNGISGEFYRYKGERPAELNDKILMFIHGGGFMVGSVASRRYMCVNALHYAKLDGFSVEYTQYPEGEYPEGLVDVIRAFRGLVQRGYKPENIYLMGESGGAMLCLALTLYLKDHKKPLPGKVCVFSPPTILNREPASRTERNDRDPMISSNLNAQLDIYLSEYDKQSKYLTTVDADFDGFPKLLVNVGTEEVIWDDAFTLAEKAKAAGVDVEFKPWEGMFHSFPICPAPESLAAMEYAANFLLS